MSYLAAYLPSPEGNLPIPCWARFRPQEQDVICGPDWDDPTVDEMWAVVRAVADSFAEVNSGLKPSLKPDLYLPRFEKVGNDRPAFRFPVPPGLAVPPRLLSQADPQLS